MPDRPLRAWARPLAWPLVAMIYLYRATLSPIIGRQCRFIPTCSQYALDALRDHGPIRGAWMAARRVARCHPLTKGGYDPVSPRDDSP